MARPFPLIFLILLSSAWAQELDKSNKKPKSFSLFSVVQFQNSVCTATPVSNPPTKGTCYTASECSSNGGTSSGSCASGFGVCCVIRVSSCGSTFSKNNTYIQNPNFPSGITATGSCAYSIQSTTDICQIRLDFDLFVIGNPAANGNCRLLDRVTITGGSGTGPNANPPVLCGVLTGSHIYVETGRAATPNTAITIQNNALITPVRTWKIRVTQIECSNPSRAPTDCLQYFTGEAGTFQSFNFQAATGQITSNLNYKICLRQEEGFCSCELTEVDGSTAAAPNFNLGGGVGAERVACAAARLVIRTLPFLGAADHYCGVILSTLQGDDTPGVVELVDNPFEIGVLTVDAVGVAAPSGFNLNFRMVPC